MWPAICAVCCIYGIIDECRQPQLDVTWIILYTAFLAMTISWVL
ncbi:MAG: hypothetical protein ACYDHZ_10735 [Dehalococcoidia bacterium]